jgi:CheY-like chemotaxis protein
VELQSRLISDILDVSRILNGKLRLLLAPVDARAIVQAAVDALRPAFGAKRLALRLELDDPGAPLVADPERLQQIVWNVLSNAIKFTPAAGEIRLELVADPARVEITISDDGPGIPEEFLPFIFDRFRQADASRTRTHQGLGLGLAITRHLVEMHGGTIEAANRRDGTGAEFRIVLPRRDLPAKAGGEDGRGHLGEEPERNWLSGAPSLRELSVLVVDDEADGRDVLAAALRACGAEVETAASAAEAYESFRRSRPSVLVSDIGMAGEDGCRLIERIRALPPGEGGRTPAAALTAYAAAQDRMTVLRAGFDAHIAKPVYPAEIARVVAQIARLRRSG